MRGSERVCDFKNQEARERKKSKERAIKRKKKRERERRMKLIDQFEEGCR